MNVQNLNNRVPLCLPGNHPPSDVHSSSRQRFQLGSKLCFNLQLPVGRHVSVSCLFFLPLLNSDVPEGGLRGTRCLCECRPRWDVCCFFCLGQRAKRNRAEGRNGEKLWCSWTNTADLAQICLAGTRMNVFGSARVSAEGLRLPTACLKSWPACFYSATSDGGSSTAKHGEVIDAHVSEFLHPG